MIPNIQFLSRVHYGGGHLLGFASGDVVIRVDHVAFSQIEVFGWIQSDIHSVVNFLPEH